MIFVYCFMMWVPKNLFIPYDIRIAVHFISSDLINEPRKRELLLYTTREDGYYGQQRDDNSQRKRNASR